VQSEAYFDSQAADTLATVNLYLSTIADMVKKHNGTLDKYIGDCVMAFWGAPVPNERHALACVLAAIDAQRGMQALNDARAAENRSREQENLKRVAAGQEPLSMLPLLSLGSGINSGTAIVGLMGSNAHILNYTVFGRDVNLASRLEGYSGRGRIIISEATFLDLHRDDAVLAATCVKLDSVTPKGFREPIPVYEVPWRQDAPAALAPGS
jgi:adenylate cyclase